MIIASTGQDVAASLTFSSRSLGTFSILATATSPCISKTSGQTSIHVSSPTQVSLSTRTFMFSPPFFPVQQNMVCKMALAFEDVNKFFSQKKASSGGWKSLFLSGSPKSEEKLGKSMKPTTIIHFSGFLLKRGLTGTGHKKPFPKK